MAVPGNATASASGSCPIWLWISVAGRVGHGSDSIAHHVALRRRGALDRSAGRAATRPATDAHAATVLRCRVDALLAFAAALLALRLAAQLARRWRTRRRPNWPRGRGRCSPTRPPRPRSPGGQRPAGATTRSASTTSAARCSRRAARRRVAAARRAPLGGPLALAWVGLATGVMLAEPSPSPSAGTAIPAAQDHLDSSPHACSRSPATRSGPSPPSVSPRPRLRRRPLGNALLLAGIGVAALGSALAGLGVAGTALFAAPPRSSSTAGSPLRRGQSSSARLGAAFGTRPAPLSQPDPGEPAGERERERGLRDRAVRRPRGRASAARSSHSPPTV